MSVEPATVAYPAQKGRAVAEVAGSGGLENGPTEGAAAQRVTAACPHCGTAVEGTRGAFCCHGCEVAWEIIRGAGLERYYEVRTALPPRPEPWTERWDGLPVEPSGDGTCELRLAIDGLRCASCVWVVEKVLEQTEGVTEATVSYASGRATVRWDPARTRLGELAGTIASLGYRPRLLGSEATPDRTLLIRLGVAAFAASNVMMFSAALYAGWLGPMEPAFVELFRWLSLALATPVALWSAAPFFEGALAGLRHRVLHMDVPIALAVAVLYGQGVVGTLLGFDTYLDSLTMLVTLLLGGRLLESGGRRRAAEAAVTLAATVPSTARRIVGETVEVVASAELRPGDSVAVGAGEDLPADGVVVGGGGAVRRALLTGESRAVPAAVGDEVWAGTVLQEGALTVRVSVEPESTLVRRMAEQLRRAQDEGGRPTSTDRIAPWFTGATLATAVAAFVGWSLAAGAGVALEVTVAVLVVACPCALALSRPLAAAAGLGAAARRGLLLRSADALLDMADVDLVVLDKTGTVTEGAVDVVEARDEDLRVASALERFSVHPVASAIVREAIRRGAALPAAEDVREVAGVGIDGRVDGVAWSLRSAGEGAVRLRSEHGREGLIRYGDRLRSGSPDAVARLEGLGTRVVLLTGDDTAPSERIAAHLGGVEQRSRITPEGKVEAIGEWHGEGLRVLFAGDGLNDGPALAAADVGVAMGSGAASSILAADAVIASDSVEPLAAGIRVGRVCRRAILVNQARSIAYNVVAVGAALAGWINPLAAAVLMPLSSAMVLAGAARVERVVSRLERRDAVPTEEAP